MATTPPDKIKVPVPKDPVSVMTWNGLAQERRKEYDTVAILKQRIESLETRLFNAGIP